MPMALSIIPAIPDFLSLSLAFRILAICFLASDSDLGKSEPPLYRSILKFVVVKMRGSDDKHDKNLKIGVWGERTA